MVCLNARLGFPFKIQFDWRQTVRSVKQNLRGSINMKEYKSPDWDKLGCMGKAFYGTLAIVFLIVVIILFFYWISKIGGTPSEIPADWR